MDEVGTAALQQARALIDILGDDATTLDSFRAALSVAERLIHNVKIGTAVSPASGD